VQVLITGCSGIIGPALIRWLLTNSDAMVVGTNEHHERLKGLLNVPRFTFYVATSGEYAELVRALLHPSDVVVSLSSTESISASDMERWVDQSAHDELVRSCAAVGARLIYVTPAETIDAGPVPSEATVESDIITELHRRLLRPPEMDEPVDSVVVRTFGVISERLETIPRPPENTLTALMEALVDNTAVDIPIAAEDLSVHAFVAVEDVAECLGRLVLDDGSRTSGEVVDLANPSNAGSIADIAQVTLARFSARHWNGADPLPRIVDQRQSRTAQYELPNTTRANRLTGWRPHRTLTDAIDAAVDHLASVREARRSGARNGQPPVTSG